ncbi:MAG: GDP-mannose 4,6-dehydratase, partial [Deltaproteobacteria bacterium]|nr:GDP-mannose 4,6-dehydratase [Deltaproteobacteria bacterium]
MPRALITGGAGFIGSHLCERLLAEGYDVICMDNLLTGDVSNITHLQDRRLQFFHYDVTNFLYVDGPLDCILHFASPASPRDYLEFPIQTLKVGSLGTHKALGLARAKGSRFLLASTSEVYGDPAGVEEARRTLPEVDYGADPYDTATGCDALIILTEWNQ